MTDKRLTGSGKCACGAVGYQTFAPLRDSISCHCETCRRWTGHFLSATACLTDKLVIDGMENLAWFAASDVARRGFCKRCGSSMFWQHKGRDTTSITSGTLDMPTGIREVKHIYLEEKSDYYQIDATA